MNVDTEITVARHWVEAVIEANISGAIESTAHLREHHVRAMAQRFRKLERDIFGAMRATRRQA